MLGGARLSGVQSNAAVKERASAAEVMFVKRIYLSG
jgi:hypothetical protein